MSYPLGRLIDLDTTALQARSGAGFTPTIRSLLVYWPDGLIGPEKSRGSARLGTLLALPFLVQRMKPPPAPGLCRSSGVDRVEGAGHFVYKEYMNIRT